MRSPTTVAEPQHVPPEGRMGHVRDGPDVSLLPVHNTDYAIVAMDNNDDAWLQTDTLVEARR